MPSDRSAKDTLPWPRTARRRPAIRTSGFCASSSSTGLLLVPCPRLAHRLLNPETPRVRVLTELVERVKLGAAVGDQLIERLLAFVRALQNTSPACSRAGYSNMAICLRRIAWGS